MQERTKQSLVGITQILVSVELLTRGGSNALEWLGVAGLVTAAATPSIAIEASRRAVKKARRVVDDLVQARRGT